MSPRPLSLDSRAGRCLLALFLFVAQATAAPAPFSKPPRHEPTLGQLLQHFRAEGYAVSALERGPNAGEWTITIRKVVLMATNRFGGNPRQVPRDITYKVTTEGGASEPALRAFLQRMFPRAEAS
jgi:hypothetical protein